MENMEKKEGEKIDEKSWVVQVESGLDSEDRSDESHDGLIHTVPKSLMAKNPEFYLPQVISLGPYHFETKDAQKDYMERLKSEVARKMHLKIITKGGLKSVMEKFKKEEKQRKLRESYAKNFELSSEACAWMIVRDACFVLEVLERFREDEDADEREKREALDRFGEDEDAEKSVSPFIDSILSRKRHHPLLTEIVKDMLKMENQLPFWVLKKIRLCIMDGTLSRKRHHPLLTEIVKDMLKMENQLPFWALGEIRSDIVGSSDDVWFESALRNLSPIEVAKGPKRNYKRESHILQLLHDYIIDKQETTSSNKQTGTSWMTITALLNVVKRIIIFKILSPCLCSPETCVKWLFRLLYAMILLLLSPVFVMFFIWYCIRILISPIDGEIGKHVPTVEELKRVGVKFRKLKGDKIGISHIRFHESDSKLYLPEFKVDNRSEVILRNLIALEICSQEEEKPITRYAILMNDLINTSGDVGILRREGIITSKLGSDDEIAQLWNSMITSTEMPVCDELDKVASSINGYRKKWWKVLWAQFIMVHCSKPWLFLSLLGGLMLLALTLIQVICLFESCQLK